VKPRADLDNVEKRKFWTLPGLELRPLGRPVRSQSLYRLRYPGLYPKAVFPEIIFSYSDDGIRHESQPKHRISIRITHSEADYDRKKRVES
jgi:hypothetical protein